MDCSAGRRRSASQRPGARSGPMPRRLDRRTTSRSPRSRRFVLTNSWVFVKISTDAGITGWGEMLKDDAKACAAGALEVGDYLIGQDPLPGGLPLAGDSSRRVLPRRPDQDRDLERHRSGAVGHHRQGLRRAGLQADGRTDPRPRPGLRHAQRGQRRERDEGAAARHDARAVQVQRRPEDGRRGHGAVQGAAREAGTGRRHRRRVPRRDPAADRHGPDEGARALLTRGSTRRWCRRSTSS